MKGQLIYSHGDPAGIGADLIIHLANEPFWESISSPIVTIGDEKFLRSRAEELKKKVRFVALKSPSDAKKNILGTVQFYCIENCKDFAAGTPNPSNAQYIIKNLNFGIDWCLENKFSALITGPIQKSNINNGGFKNFIGHTEWIQKRTKSENVVMLLASSKLKVALATTHIPISSVPSHISKKSLVATIKTVHQGLVEKFKIDRPVITLLGLNPHAGEDGKIGQEEITAINPAAIACRKMGINVSDAISADTAFNNKQRKITDAYIGMYHDQVLPVLKALSFGKSVNITLGTPIIRTSVDHGTALNLAGKIKPNMGSVKEALAQALAQAK